MSAVITPTYWDAARRDIAGNPARDVAQRQSPEHVWRLGWKRRRAPALPAEEAFRVDAFRDE